jgi:hypothetical protein
MPASDMACPLEGWWPIYFCAHCRTQFESDFLWQHLVGAGAT